MNHALITNLFQLQSILQNESVKLVKNLVPCAFLATVEIYRFTLKWLATGSS